MIQELDLRPLDVISWLLAFFATWALIWLLKPIALRWGWLDRPTHPRKDHREATPVTGGPAIFLGVVLASVAAGAPLTPPLLALLLGSLLLLVVGVLDDKFDLRWYYRIGAQALAALLLVYLGGVQVEQVGSLFGVEETGLGALSVPLTVIATVGLINAVNMVDGIDGLAGSLCAAFMLMLFCAALYAGNGPIANRAMMLAAAVGGFLMMNLRLPWQARARAFLGNSGSAMLGYAAAWLAFRLTQNEGHPVSPVLALWLLPIPVMDTLVLMATRMVRGQSPFHADRNHIHHLMLDAGFRPMAIVASLVGFSLAIGLLAAALTRLDVPNLVLLLAFLLLCAWWGWMTMHRARAVTMFRRLRRIGQHGRDAEPLDRDEIEDIAPPH